MIISISISIFVMIIASTAVQVVRAAVSKTTQLKKGFQMRTADEYTERLDALIGQAGHDKAHFVYRRIHSLADEQMFNRLMELMDTMTYPEVDEMVGMYHRSKER